MKNLKFVFYFFSLLTSCYLHAQNLSIPNVEKIYGGRVLSLCSYKLNSDSTRVFASTQSANSVFYTDVKSLATGSSSFQKWKVLPSLNASKNLGYIANIAAHETSGKLYFIHNESLYSTDIHASTITLLESKLIRYVKVVDNHLFYIKDKSLIVNTLNASGILTKIAEISIPNTLPNLPKLVLNTSDSKLFLFIDGTAPTLYKFKDALTPMSASTKYDTINLSALANPNKHWKAFGITGTNRILIGGHSSPEPAKKLIAYSDDNGATFTEYNTGISGVSGDEIVCTFVSGKSSVFYSKLYNYSDGSAGNWMEIGTPGGIETHPNDGGILADKNNPNLIYVTTDQGIGASVDNGKTLFEINNGMEAIQVNDINMTTNKDTAWIASKSGIRRVTNYKSTPNWTNAMFPNGDGSPYYSIAMHPKNSNIAYAGNVRIYKTMDAGATWKEMFSPEKKYAWLPQMYRFEAIEICPWDPNLIVAGAFYLENEKGGLFYSTDGGLNWQQQYIYISSGNKDVDVWDLTFNKEAGNTVLYVGVEYNTSSRSIYKLTWDATTKNFTVKQDMDATGTSVGYPISASILDLETSNTGDTILACGTDVGSNHAIAYFKSISGTNKWTPFTTSGFPMITGKIGKAITKGIDTIYVAVDHEVYILPATVSTWSLGYSYPTGTEINFLYYDDLLIGTGTGLYGHTGVKSNTSSIEFIANNGSNDVNITLYPSPTSKELFVNSKHTIKSIHIHSLLGKEVYSIKKESNDYIIDVENFHSGIYVITFEDQYGVYTSKFSKN